MVARKPSFFCKQHQLGCTVGWFPVKCFPKHVERKSEKLAILHLANEDLTGSQWNTDSHEIALLVKYNFQFSHNWFILNNSTCI